MQCTKPIRLTKNLSPLIYPDGLTVPCGKCYNCRISKRREWTMRMLHELDSWKDSVFVTLTYSDEWLPDKMTLKKSDLQKFFKRLRKQIEPRKLKYFACGEYGNPPQVLSDGSISVGYRPHYHAIIFGLGIQHKAIIIKCWPFADWSNTAIEKNSFGLAEPDSIRYCAQYIDSKLSGEEAKKEYDDKGREPVFRVLSQGIGKEFVKKNSEQLIHNESITMFGKKMSFPRYYLTILGLENSTFRKENAILKDMEQVEYYTNIEGLTFDDFYKLKKPSEVIKLNEAIMSSRKQHEKNLQAKSSVKTKKL